MPTFDELEAAAKEQNNHNHLEPGDDCPEDHCELELKEHRHPFRPRFRTRPATAERELYCLHDGIISRA